MFQIVQLLHSLAALKNRVSYRGSVLPHLLSLQFKKTSLMTLPPSLSEFSWFVSVKSNLTVVQIFRNAMISKQTEICEKGKCLWMLC